jgi:hypothetical protein
MNGDDARFQLITAHGWDSERRALIKPHVVHRGRFVIYCECAGDWPDDTFSLEIRRVDSGVSQVPAVLGTEAFREYDFVVFAMRLPPGRWEIRVHSASARAAVASRKVTTE